MMMTSSWVVVGDKIINKIIIIIPDRPTMMTMTLMKKDDRYGVLFFHRTTINKYNN
jgi:hypothetical protein